MLPRSVRLPFLTKLAAVMLFAVWAVGHPPAQGRLTEHAIATKIVPESRHASCATGHACACPQDLARNRGAHQAPLAACGQPATPTR
jgi:hypothetical protein